MGERAVVGVHGRNVDAHPTSRTHQLQAQVPWAQQGGAHEHDCIRVPPLSQPQLGQREGGTGTVVGGL